MQLGYLLKQKCDVHFFLYQSIEPDQKELHIQKRHSSVRDWHPLSLLFLQRHAPNAHPQEIRPYLTAREPSFSLNNPLTEGGFLDSFGAEVHPSRCFSKLLRSVFHRIRCFRNSLASFSLGGGPNCWVEYVRVRLGWRVCQKAPKSHQENSENSERCKTLFAKIGGAKIGHMDR